MIVAKGFEAETLEELKTRIINFYSEKHKHMPTINYILQINEDGSEDIFSDDIVAKFNEEVEQQISDNLKLYVTPEDVALDRWYSEKGDR